MNCQGVNIVRAHRAVQGSSDILFFPPLMKLTDVKTKVRTKENETETCLGGTFVITTAELRENQKKI